jgi:hypothetical protein
MWETRRLTTLWAFTASYRNNFSFYPNCLVQSHLLPKLILVRWAQPTSRSGARPQNTIGFVIGLTSVWSGLLQNPVAVTGVYGSLRKRRLTRENEKPSLLPWDRTGTPVMWKRPPTAWAMLWPDVDTVGLIWPTQCVQVLLGLCSLKIQDMNYFQNFTLSSDWG